MSISSAKSYPIACYFLKYNCKVNQLLPFTAILRSVFFIQSILYQLLYSVVLPIPSIFAAIFLLPAACFKARRIRPLSSSPLFNVKQAGSKRTVHCQFQIGFGYHIASDCRTAVCIFCFNSRTLPGHAWASRALRQMRQTLLLHVPTHGLPFHGRTQPMA